MCVTYSSVCNIVTENEWLTNPHCYDTIWWNAIPSLLYVSVKMDFIDWKMLFIYCRSTSIESSSLTANCLHRSNSVESSFLKINRMNSFECTNLCLFHNSFCFFLSLFISIAWKWMVFIDLTMMALSLNTKRSCWNSIGLHSNDQMTFTEDASWWNDSSLCLHETFKIVCGFSFSYMANHFRSLIGRCFFQRHKSLTCISMVSCVLLFCCLRNAFRFFELELNSMHHQLFCSCRLMRANFWIEKEFHFFVCIYFIKKKIWKVKKVYITLGILNFTNGVCFESPVLPYLVWN